MMTGLQWPGAAIVVSLAISLAGCSPAKEPAVAGDHPNEQVRRNCRRPLPRQCPAPIIMVTGVPSRFLALPTLAASMMRRST